MELSEIFISPTTYQGHACHASEGGRDGPPSGAWYQRPLCAVRWCSYQATHWPWFLNDGDVKFRQPPFLHWLFAVGPVTGSSSVPLTVIALRSAVP
jgi:hypothetical protein